MATDSSLSAKIAIITGAGTGIGRAIACELAAAGATVELVGRRIERLRETIEEIGSAGRANSHAVDITDGPALQNMVKTISAGGRRIDIIVNAGGISAITDLADADRTGFASVIDTNLNAAFDLVTLALPHMPDGGRVVNIASVLGVRPAPKSAAYCASKHGMIGLTRALALDLAPRGITVNAICPGWVDTDMSRDIIAAMAKERGVSVQDMQAAVEAGIPIGRMVEAREVALLTAYLCSPAVAAITGQAISICAGSSIS